MATKRSGLAAIDSIVVVMLENRSFDSMLGYLYAQHGNRSPLGQPFDGLTGKELNKDSSGKTVTVSPIKATDPHPYFMPGSDPGDAAHPGRPRPPRAGLRQLRLAPAGGGQEGTSRDSGPAQVRAREGRDEVGARPLQEVAEDEVRSAEC